METRAGRVAGIVLAAGSSTRMGRNKMLLTVGTRPLVRRSVQAALEAGLDPVLAVVGHEADRVRAAIAGLPCQVVFNPDYAVGMRVSLQAGVRAVPGDVPAALIALADMPFVTAEMMRTVADRYHQGTAPLVVSEYGGVNAPPTLYDRALFAELLAMTGAGSGKQVLLRHKHQADVVPWPAEALADLDVPADYERIGAQIHE
jgi:molybdenum cofactor cytidylyltransferase